MSNILLQKKDQIINNRSCQLENFLENLNHQQKPLRKTVSEEPKIEFNSKTNKDSFELFFGFPFAVSSQNLTLKLKMKKKFYKLIFNSKVVIKST